MGYSSINTKTFAGLPDQYFATLPIEDLLEQLTKKIDDYADYCLRTGRLTTWRSNWEMWMRSEMKIGVRFGGDRGQYKLIESNIYKSIVTGLVSTLANQRPSFQPEAINDDYKSMSQDIIFNSVCNYYLKVKRMEDSYKQALTYGLICGEGWLYEKWNADIGEIVDVTTNEAGQELPIKEGDVQFVTLGPMDVIRDYTRMDVDNDWLIVREYLNKWDVISQRPDLQEDLAGLTLPTTLQRFRFGHIVDGQTANSDLIPIYTFLHRKTASCPNGRLVQFVDGKIWMIDVGMPYDEMPVYAMMPDVTPFNNFGTTVMTSLVKLQYAYDKTVSLIVTNQQAFALQNIVIDQTTQTKPEQVIEGLNFIKTDMQNGVPVGLQLCKTPEEVFKFLDLLESQMEKLSGLPSILRGTPPTGVESGTAMAFLQAQALVFNSPVQQSYISFLERSATGLFNILKSFANTKRMITVAGQSKKPYMDQFSGSDLSNISRVIVSAGNPATRSEAGKLQVAQDLMAKGLVDLKEYFQVLETGQLDPMLTGPEAENMLIVEENELLRRGIPQVVNPTDNHVLHLHQHNTILMDPALRKAKDNPVVAATLSHMLEHGKILVPGLMALTDPQFLAIFGIQVGAPVASPAPAGPEQPTPPPIPNPMPAPGVGHPGVPMPKPPILPRNTPQVTATAAPAMTPALAPHLPTSNGRA